jgi:hypothetical protein
MLTALLLDAGHFGCFIVLWVLLSSYKEYQVCFNQKATYLGICTICSLFVVSLSKCWSCKDRPSPKSWLFYDLYWTFPGALRTLHCSWLQLEHGSALMLAEFRVAWKLFQFCDVSIGMDSCVSPKTHIQSISDSRALALCISFLHSLLCPAIPNPSTSPRS